MIGYKLFRKRKDGSYGPLFINKAQKLVLNVEYPYMDVPTKGYAHRPGWHLCDQPIAPHLSKKNRVWCKVQFTHMATLHRPASQGGTWYLGKSIKIIEEVVGA